MYIDPPALLVIRTLSADGVDKPMPKEYSDVTTIVELPAFTNAMLLNAPFVCPS
jgi:hypothetical protein